MTSVSKNMYINNLADIVNKYNNTYHSAIKIKPADVKWGIYIDLQNFILHIGLRKIFVFKKVKKNCAVNITY